MKIDLAAAARRLRPQEIADWAADQRAFISSIMEGLADERRAVARAIAELGAEAVWFEEFGGRDDDPVAAYLSEVRSCSIYLGILGRAYGRTVPDLTGGYACADLSTAALVASSSARVLADAIRHDRSGRVTWPHARN